LTREHHPDLKINSTESERKMLSAVMAQLNGAYAVLSDVKLRREYDESLKILTSLDAGSTVSRVAETGTRSASGGRPAPASDVDRTLAHELSLQLRSNLLARLNDFSCRPRPGLCQKVRKGCGRRRCARESFHPEKPFSFPASVPATIGMEICFCRIQSIFFRSKPEKVRERAG
jgi:hypothetical protein